MEKQGLVVERAGKPVATLKCRGQPTSLLGPDWCEKVDVKSHGQHVNFPD